MTEKQLKSSEALRKAKASYYQKNKEKIKLIGYRNDGKLYIKDYAQLEDLEVFEELIIERKKLLENS
jgi:hypothetical protein